MTFVFSEWNVKKKNSSISPRRKVGRVLHRVLETAETRESVYLFRAHACNIFSVSVDKLLIIKIPVWSETENLFTETLPQRQNFCM